MALAHASIDFDSGEAYTGNRPVTDIVLHGPGGSLGATTWTGAQVLVDTGADYLHLPQAAIDTVGISMAGAQTYRILTGGGTVVMKRVSVEVEIAGTKVTVPCNVMAGARPVVGRQAMFTVLETAGFSTTEWLLDPW
jgi:predicted aspartyl protease